MGQQGERGRARGEGKEKRLMEKERREGACVREEDRRRTGFPRGEKNVRERSGVVYMRVCSKGG